MVMTLNWEHLLWIHLDWLLKIICRYVCDMCGVSYLPYIYTTHVYQRINASDPAMAGKVAELPPDISRMNDPITEADILDINQSSSDDSESSEEDASYVWSEMDWRERGDITANKNNKRKERESVCMCWRKGGGDMWVVCNKQQKSKTKHYYT